MTSNNNNTETETEIPIQKNQHRDDRLSFSNYAEHTLRKELNTIALKKCNHFIQEFGTCSQKQGLFVIFKCRSQMNTLNKCLGQYNSDEAFDAFKRQKEEELIIDHTNKSK